MTIARYYTPNGRTIQNKGITPDIEVDRIDVALLEKAKKGKFLREADLDNHLLREDEKNKNSSDDDEEGRAPKSEKESKADKKDERLFRRHRKKTERRFASMIPKKS